MTAVLARLNPAALVTLADCEQRIERGLRTFIDVGQALAEIRDSRLYKGTHETFEAYCQERWEIDRTRAQNFITAARTVLEISNTRPDLPAPVKESQARALAAVPDTERAEVWREVVESGEKITAEAIRETAKARINPTPGPTGAAHRPPADPGKTPAPAADESPVLPTPQEPDPISAMPPPKPAPEPSAEEAAQLSGAILAVLAEHTSPAGMTVTEIWTRLPMPSVHSSWIEPVLHELADAGRVDPAGRALRGTRMESLWRLAETPEPVAASTAPAGPGAGAGVAPWDDGATAAPAVPPPGSPATWTPEQHEANRREVQARQIRESGIRHAKTVAATLAAEIGCIVDAFDLGERDLITEELIAELHAAVDLLATRIEARA